MALRQIRRHRIEAQLAAMQVEVGRDGTIGGAARYQLRDVQLQIGIRAAQQIERDRRIRDDPAAGGRLAGRRGSRRCACTGRRRPGERGTHRVEVDVVGRHLRLHRWPAIAAARGGALDRQVRSQRLHDQIERDRSGRLDPGQQTGRRANRSGDGRGHAVEAALGGDLHRLIQTRGRQVELVEPQPCHDTGQVGGSDMQRQARNIRRRGARIRHLCRQADIVQRRQIHARQKRRESRQVGDVRGDLAPVAARQHRLGNRAINSERSAAGLQLRLHRPGGGALPVFQPVQRAERAGERERRAVVGR